MQEALHRVQRLAHNVLESMVQGVIVVGRAGGRDGDQPGGGAAAGSRTRRTRPGCSAVRSAELPAAGAELAALVEEASTHDEPAWDRKVDVERDGCHAPAAGRRAGDQGAGWARLSGCILLLRDLTRSLLVEERIRGWSGSPGWATPPPGWCTRSRTRLTALSHPHPAPGRAAGRVRRRPSGRRADRRAQGRGRPAQQRPRRLLGLRAAPAAWRCSRPTPWLSWNVSFN